MINFSKPLESPSRNLGVKTWEDRAGAMFWMSFAPLRWTAYWVSVTCTSAGSTRAYNWLSSA